MSTKSYHFDSKNLLFIVYLKLLVSIFECKDSNKTDILLCYTFQILWQINHGVRKKTVHLKKKHTVLHLYLQVLPEIAVSVVVWINIHFTCILPN